MTASQNQRLATIELNLTDGKRGRVFMFADVMQSTDEASLSAEFERRFFDVEDANRWELLRRAVSTLASIDFQIYPGEGVPVENHAYLIAPTISTEPIFACVLGTNAVVRDLLANARVVFETSTFQGVGDVCTLCAAIAALEVWAARIWPDLSARQVRVCQWPDQLLEGPPFELLPLTSQEPMRGAPEELPQERWLQ